MRQIQTAITVSVPENLHSCMFLDVFLNLRNYYRFDGRGLQQPNKLPVFTLPGLFGGRTLLFRAGLNACFGWGCGGGLEGGSLPRIVVLKTRCLVV